MTNRQAEKKRIAQARRDFARDPFQNGMTSDETTRRAAVISRVKADLAIAKAIARKHIQAAAKFTALFETFGEEWTSGDDTGGLQTHVVRGGYTFADCRAKMNEAKRLAIHWQWQADVIAGWLRKNRAA